MHISIAILMGIVAAWAMKRRNGHNHLGWWWRVAAGATAGGFPHIDGFLGLLSPAFELKNTFGFTWSFLMLPIYALILAFGFEFLSGGRYEGSTRTWQHFYLPVFGAMFIVLFFSLLTSVGIMPLAPLLDWRVAGDIIYDFDYFMLGICLLVVAIGLLIPYWVRDIARIALIVMGIYCLIVTTFYFKAGNVGERYAEKRELKVAEMAVLPQPLSPFHWRIIIETENHRLYDTMFHLFLKEERVVQEDTSRAGRIAALYKPVDHAWWRIYNRFGRDNVDFVEKGWETFEKSRYRWFARYAYFRKLTTYEGLNCALLNDLRYEGARRHEQGRYLLCDLEGEEGWMLYQADKDGAFRTLERIY